MNNFSWEKKYKKLGFVCQRKYPNEALIQFLAKYYFHLFSSKRKKLRILELGCGSGANLWMITKEGFSAYGIDISSTAIDLCKRMMKDWDVVAKICVGDMRQLNFDDNYFDMIFDVVSMQHINLSDHYQSYKEVFRCLKRAGRFFQWHLGAKSISFTKGGGKRVDKLTLDNISNPDVPLYDNSLTCFLTVPKAKAMLKSVGFKNISIESFTRTYKEMTQIIEYLAISAQK